MFEDIITYVETADHWLELAIGLALAVAAAFKRVRRALKAFVDTLKEKPE